MNNTLEGISGRISKAEERISDLEDRIVEINATRQNTEKRMEKKKRRRQPKRPLGQHQTHHHSLYRGPRSRREIERT